MSAPGRLQRGTFGAPPAAARTGATAGRIGPNAITRVAEVLPRHVGAAGGARAGARAAGHAWTFVGSGRFELRWPRRRLPRRQSAPAA